MEFNKSQLEAIRHFKGPCMTLAGPGSGKTTVLTHRILNLIENCDVKPENILVITFTKAAAEEMKERFVKISDNRYLGVTFQTFHSFYFMVLKSAYKYRAENIITRQEQVRFLKNILSDYELEIIDTTELVNNMIDLIGNVKRSGKAPSELQNIYQGVCSNEVFLDVYKKYQKYLDEKRYIDFEDMTLFCYELFLQRKDILKQWQERYTYVLVDEFQDIDLFQFKTLQFLVSKYRNLFIVGDDDQSIYGFRGACPDFMQDFQKIYPEAVRIDLSVNYRCCAGIVSTAKSVIAHNKNRFQKNIISAVAGEAEQAVDIKEFESKEQQDIYLAKKILQLSKKSSYSDTAILLRTNTGGQELIQLLLQYKIPFIMKERFLNPFEHWIAQDILAYVHMAMGSRERKYLLRIINRPVRYISRDAFPDAVVDFDKAKAYYIQKSNIYGQIEQLESDIRFLTGISPFAAVNYIKKAMGYENYIKQYAKEKKYDVQNLLNILEQILQSTKKYMEYSEWLNYIDSYTEQSNEIHNIKKDDVKDGVHIHTIHGAKGLEYENVFIPDLMEGNIPYHKAVLEREIEEERRLFYVAMTRAKNNLFLYYTTGEKNEKKVPSRFLSEIKKEEKQ